MSILIAIGLREREREREEGSQDPGQGGTWGGYNDKMNNMFFIILEELRVV
jgi:hypothetical protein